MYAFHIFSKNRPSGPILSVSQNVRKFVCLFVCPSHFVTPFNGLFAPIFRSSISNFFGFLESLGKTVVSDLKTLAHKGCKIARAKKKNYGFFSFIHSILTSFCPHFPKSNFQAFKIFGILGGEKWKEVVSDLRTFAHKGCKTAAQRNCEKIPRGR